jgi:prepilin-type N-terminal cleavage/methylation domain-containing protein/prepilin-type processing-associated H-X9-DG protein
MKPAPRHPNAPAGFSLVELLITLALVLILTTMMFGFGSARHQRNQKQLCADNLQKIYLALQIYANDFNGNLPQNTNAQTSEAVLDALVPRYTVDTSIFICPGGRDSSIPPGESFRNGKISYAYYMGCPLTNSQEVLLSDRQVDTRPKRPGEIVFSTNGKPPGNNHHKYGGNFLFGDGSVQSSPPELAFPLLIMPGVVLLNPKP